MNCLTLFLLSAAVATPAANPTETRPPAFNLSDLIQAVATDRDTVAAVFKVLGRDPAAPAPLTQEQFAWLLAAVLRHDWDTVEHFPTVTVAELGKTFALAGERDKQARVPPLREEFTQTPVREALGLPTGKPPHSFPGRPQTLGLGVTYGVVASEKENPHYADSERLAEVLNRLALNEPSKPAVYTVLVEKQEIQHPQELLHALQATGHKVVVREMRGLADFGKLSYKGQAVTTPLWMDTEIKVPDRKYTLKVPACHCEHDVVITGPVVNAEVDFYLGRDGARFRPICYPVLDWIDLHPVHEYEGEKAEKAVRIIGEVIGVYADKLAEHPGLRFGGYFTLGVCLDSNAYVEYALNGHTTLYPLTRDLDYFQGDSEVEQLARRMPDDQTGKPDLDRILGSLPEAEFRQRYYPRLQADLERVQAAEARRPEDNRSH